MPKIFISYRRDDSAYATGVIRDHLAQHLPGCEIFLDVDSIPYGVDFRRHLENSVAACDYLVAVIGKRWLTVVDSRGQRRIDDPNDAVRVEVETALGRAIPLIPVFLDGMDVPPADALPESIRRLVAHNAVFVRPPPDFNRDVDKLVHAFRHWLEQLGEAPVETAPATAEPPPIAPPTPRRARNKTTLALAAMIAIAIAAAGWWWYRAAIPAPEYRFVDSYLFEDPEPRPRTWEPHPHMLEGGFKLPIEFVHWVVRIEHPVGMRPMLVPLDCRLLDESGEIVRFTGLSEELPEQGSPHPGKAEWMLNFGGRSTIWKPGKYTLELDTPDQSLTATFTVSE